MNTLLLLLSTLIGSFTSFFLIYQFIKNSGSKLDYLKASELAQSGNYSEAEKYYKLALKKTNGKDYVHLSSLMGLQNIYFNCSKLKESLEYLEKAIKISEKNSKWRQINAQLRSIKDKHFS